MSLGKDVESGNGSGLKKGFSGYDEESFAQHIKFVEERRKLYAKQTIETTKEHNLSNIEANISEQTGSHAQEDIQEETERNKKANIITPVEAEVINIINKNMAGLKEEIIKNRQEINELRKYVSAFSNVLEEASQYDAYFRPVDREQKELLVRVLFEHNIPHQSFYSPEGDVYLTSSFHKKRLEELGLKLKVVEIKNIGVLSKEERDEVKRYHRSQKESRRKKALDELRKEYGSL